MTLNRSFSSCQCQPGALTFHLGEVLLHFPGARFAVQGYLEHNHHLVKEMPMQMLELLNSMETHVRLLSSANIAIAGFVLDFDKFYVNIVLYI
jgi:hypothetical protein